MESNLTNGYLEAYNIACSELGKKDPRQIAMNTGCEFDEASRRLNVHFLNTDHFVSFPDGEVKRADGAAVSTAVKTLILHYLLHAKKTSPTENMVSFREVRKGGMNYYPVFQKRAMLPLQKAFESEPEKLAGAALHLGGSRMQYGDASVTISVFPFVPVTYVIWGKDEENSASASILFDYNISGYLPCEDIVLAASLGAYELIKKKDQSPVSL